MLLILAASASMKMIPPMMLTMMAFLGFITRDAAFAYERAPLRVA